jgi:hypothetical protein
MQRPHPRCLVGAAAGLVVGIAFAAMGFPARLRATPVGLCAAACLQTAWRLLLPARRRQRGIVRRLRRSAEFGVESGDAGVLRLPLIYSSTRLCREVPRNKRRSLYVVPLRSASLQFTREIAQSAKKGTRHPNTHCAVIICQEKKMPGKVWLILFNAFPMRPAATNGSIFQRETADVYRLFSVRGR